MFRILGIRNDRLGHSAALLPLACCLVASLSLAAQSSAPPAGTLAPAPAGLYKVDLSHASVELRINHMGFSTYTTRFRSFEADLTFDPNNIAASKVVTSIDTSSIELDAWPQQCVDILKGPQLLNTEKHPRIEFRSDHVRMTGPKTMQISGTLTVLGVSRPIMLESSFNGGYASMGNMDPNARIGFSAHGSFKRSDFGMNFGIPTAGTTVGVGDSIQVDVEAEFRGPPLAASKPQD